MKVIWFRRENYFYHLSFRKVHHTHFEEIVIDHFEEKNIVISNCISYLIPLKVSAKGCSVATMRRSLTWEMTKFSSRTPNTDSSVQRLRSCSASLSFQQKTYKHPVLQTKNLCDFRPHRCRWVRAPIWVSEALLRTCLRFTVSCPSVGLTPYTALSWCHPQAHMRCGLCREF